MYVDDLLESRETVESAQHLQRDLSELLSVAGFRLRKWSSNEPSVLANIPESDRLTAVEIKKDEQTGTKTLGILWNPGTDTFTFKVEPPPMMKHPTKRNVLSTIATVYDHLSSLHHSWLEPKS